HRLGDACPGQQGVGRGQAPRSGLAEESLEARLLAEPEPSYQVQRRLDHLDRPGFTATSLVRYRWPWSTPSDQSCADDQRSTLPVGHRQAVIEDAPAVRFVGVESPRG